MRKRILLADDSVTIQKVVELTFSEEDYEVTVVGDGAQAIELALPGLGAWIAGYHLFDRMMRLQKIS